MGKLEDDLLKLQADRRQDRRQAKTRRRRQTEAAPERLEGLVTQFFSREDGALRKIEEQKALMAWEELVGAAAAAVSRAERLRGTQLVVRVKDPLWMHQLYLLKNELIRQYRARFPGLKIDDIYYAGW